MPALTATVLGFTDADNHRSASVDRTLVAAMKAIAAALPQLQQARDQYFALNLPALLAPLGATDWVHKERDASTKQEQADIDAFLAYVNFHVYGIGAQPASTQAQIATILKRYAR